MINKCSRYDIKWYRVVAVYARHPGMPQFKSTLCPPNGCQQLEFMVFVNIPGKGKNAVQARKKLTDVYGEGCRGIKNGSIVVIRSDGIKYDFPLSSCHLVQLLYYHTIPNAPLSSETRPECKYGRRIPAFFFFVDVADLSVNIQQKSPFLESDGQIASFLFNDKSRHTLKNFQVTC
ncbi:hypothetical protein TNCT_22261 [Trichonephila clavata]|uniref:Uncharacterized protein n=1 Tax=Trichonephila clavata TaxID=2740835 RepID=A0A8X6IIA5_TRICU|nr:hypothetical protein TNCT_22261 [Trichonephila clavata]